MNEGLEQMIDEGGIPEGKLLLEDVFMLKIEPDSLIEEGEGKAKKFRLRGRFGLVEQATANGRVYTRKIMERELKRLHESVVGRKVYGELDHPCLTSDDFRVLTEVGWKAFRDVRVGDHVWSRKDGQAVLSEVTGIIDEPYDGPAYHVRGRSIDATFTPAHKFLLVKRPDRHGAKSEEFVTLAEIAEHPERYVHHAVPKTAAFFAEAMPHVTIPGVQSKRLASCKNDVSQPLVLDAGLFAAFLGIYLAEGHCSADSVDNYDVCITQKTPWSKRFIYDEVLSKFPAGLEWREIEKGYALADQRLYAYLKPLGDMYTKRVPAEAKRLDSNSLREMLFWFCVGDGRMVASSAAKREEMTSNGKTTKEALAEALREGTIPFTRQDAFSVSEGLVRDLHECLVRAGGAGSISRIDPDKDYEYAGHTIRAEDKVPLYQLHICQTENVWMDPRHLAIEAVHHTGNIYCLSTTHGSFYMERDGHAFWTGNSDGKTKFTRVSHLVTDIRLTENNEILGEMEFISGTINGDQGIAIAKAGGQMGVSSRGFGSTVPDTKGRDVVQEDYQLVTFDIVADPANAGAHPSFVVEHKERKSMDLDTLKKDKPEVVKALREEIEAEARDHARKALKEDFEQQLAEEAAKVREEAIAVARKQLLEDPEVAGSASAMQRIRDLVTPFILGEDENKVVAKLKREVEEANKRIAGLDEALAEAKAETAEIAGIAKELGFRLHMERELAGNDRAEQIAEMVGDVTGFETLDELKSRLGEITAALAEEDEKSEAQRKELVAAQARESKLAEERDKALALANQFGVRAYIERKIAGHVQAPALRVYLGESDAQTKDDVDRLVESFNKSNRTSREFDDVRAGLERRSRTAPTRLTEDRGSRKVAGFAIEGVSLDEIVQIADRR